MLYKQEITLKEEIIVRKDLEIKSLKKEIQKLEEENKELKKTRK